MSRVTAGSVLLGVLLASTPTLATTAAQVCDPAVTTLCKVKDQDGVNDNVMHVTDGSVLDVGTKEFQIPSNLALDAGSGMVTILAGTLRIQKLAHLRARQPLNGGSGGTIVVRTTGDIIVENSSSQTGDIDVTGDSGGIVSLTAGGNVTLNGPINAQSLNPGTIDLTTVPPTLIAAFDGGSVDVTGNLITANQFGGMNVSAPGHGGAGDLTITSTGNMTLAGDLDLRGGEGSAGFLYVQSMAGSVTTSGAIRLGGLCVAGVCSTSDPTCLLPFIDNACGDGGSGNITAAVDVSINGIVDGSSSAIIPGSLSPMSPISGTAGDFTVQAQHDVTLTKNVTFVGASAGATPNAQPGNGGGDPVEFDAGHDFVQGSGVTVDASGQAGVGTSGGNVVVSAGNAATLRNMYANSGDGGGSGSGIDVTAG